MRARELADVSRCFREKRLRLPGQLGRLVRDRRTPPLAVRRSLSDRSISCARTGAALVVGFCCCCSASGRELSRARRKQQQANAHKEAAQIDAGNFFAFCLRLSLAVDGFLFSSLLRVVAFAGGEIKCQPGEKWADKLETC